MEVGQCLGRLVGNSEASGQGNVPSMITMNELEQCAIWDKLVDQHGHFYLEAATEELDDVLVVDLG